MAVFINPKGTLIPHPERHGLDKGARIYFGTPDADTFFFGDNKNDKIIVGMGGGDTFNAAATMHEWDIRYYSFLAKTEWGMLAGGREWTPWLSGKDFVHIGGNMDAKMGLGADTIFLHGGHYTNPAQIWLQHNDTIVFAHDEGLEITGFKTVGKTVKDSDGKGYTTEVRQVSISAHSDNPITDGQKFTMMFQDQGAYVDRNGKNMWKPMFIDHDSKKITTADVEHHFQHDSLWGDVLV